MRPGPETSCDSARTCRRRAGFSGSRREYRSTDGLGRLLDWYRAQGKSPEELLEAEVIRNWDPEAAQASDRPPILTP